MVKKSTRSKNMLKKSTRSKNMFKKSTRFKIRKPSKRRVEIREVFKQYINELYDEGHHYVIQVPENKNAVDYKIVANLTVVENEGEGDCLFLSIYQYLEYINYSPLPTSIKDLRSRIVDNVISNWHKYVFALLNYGQKLQKILNRKHCPDFEKVDECQKIYRQYMLKKEWGTTVELSAAIELFDIKVVQLTLVPGDAKKLRISKDLESEAMGKPPFFLLFDGNPLEGHFRFLKTLKTIFARSNPNLDDIPVGDYQIRTTDNVTIALYVKNQQHYVQSVEWKTESESDAMSESESDAMSEF